MNRDDAEHWQRVRVLFDRVTDADPATWHALLAVEAGDDLLLQRDVLRLLDADRADDLDLDNPDLIRGEIEEGGERVGTVVSHYRLVRLIGHGGMGTVYEGIRADGAYEQRVAVKFIRPVLGAGVMAARFRRERQILAALEHRNIARLLDGGATADGAPFFVMEFVDGVSIINYCNEQHRSVDDRLRLFLQACAAVEHAHGKFIVHRDLKPANILVSADGSVKLLDFGVAKLLGVQEGEDLTTVTQAQPITPEYASPEQLRDEPASAASDVYSLGIVLYELLSGRRPFEFASRSPIAALRATETDPPLPSTVATAIAAQSTGEGDQARLRATLAGELDNVVRKAIRRDVELRYRSVEQLSADVRRYLDGLPVSAQPDRFGYRAGKFVGRHRAAVAAAAVVLLTVVVGSVVAVAQARRAGAEAVWEMAVNAAGNLDELGVEHLERGDVRGSDSLLRVAIALCDTPHAGPPPLTCARSLYDDGLALLWKGDAVAAEQVLRRVLAMVHAATPPSGVQPPELQFAAAKVDAALARARDGQGDLDGAVTLYLQSGQLFHAAGADGSPDRPETLGWFAITRERQGRFAEADSLVRLQLELSRSADRSIVQMHLADIHRRSGAGELAKAEMARARARRGVETDTTDLYYVLVTQIEAQQDLAEGKVDPAVNQLRRTLAIAARRYDASDPRLAETQNALGEALVAQHHADEAVGLLTASVATFQARYGAHHPTTLAAQHDLDAARQLTAPTLVEH